MHEPPATPSTLQKVAESQHTMAIVDSLNSDSVDERHQHYLEMKLTIGGLP